MRELRSCDFCGGDAAGTFEIVPPELEPTEAEQRRVVLCPDCKDRLETLVEPLLARAGAGDATAGSGAATDDRPTDESVSARTQPSASSSTAAGGSDGTGAPETDADPATGRDGPTDEGAESTLEDGITFDRSGGGTADDETPDAGETTDAVAVGAEAEPDDSDATPAVSSADDGTDGSSASETETETAAGSGSTSDSASSAGSPATRPPSAYRKVVRLLRNREFPMKRSAVEELAAGAYELEPDEVDAIVDYAIEQGEFVEKRGKLRRP